MYISVQDVKDYCKFVNVNCGNTADVDCEINRATTQVYSSVTEVWSTHKHLMHWPSVKLNTFKSSHLYLSSAVCFEDHLKTKAHNWQLCVVEKSHKA